MHVDAFSICKVPLTSNEEEDDDDDEEEDKEKIQCDSFISKTSSDVPTLVSTRQSLSAQYNLELCLKENNQNVRGLDDSEQISYIIDILPKGGRTLQDLTNTKFVSNNTATSENKSEDLILELPKRRRCTPLNLNEPNLRDKMRR